MLTLPICKTLSPSSPLSKPLQEDKIGFLCARSLKAILPSTWFCWVSRAIIQLQSILRPHQWSYWTKISDEIYLGAMPLKNWDHLNKIHELGIKAILSVNEDHELEDQFLAKPVKSFDWKDRNIKYLKIATPDLEPIETSKLAMAVDFVVQQVDLGNRVYIHCTAGRGRSASVAICSLVKIKGYSLEKSIALVKQCRPQIMLSNNQIKAIHEYCFT